MEFGRGRFGRGSEKGVPVDGVSEGEELISGVSINAQFEVCLE